MDLLKKIFLCSTAFMINSCVVADPKINPSINVSKSPNVIKSVEPATSSPEVMEMFTIRGFVYDQNKNKIPNANIKIRILSSMYKQDMSDKNISSDVDGMYVFRSILDNSEIEIYVSKSGYKSVTRIYTFNGNKNAVYPKFPGDINFGGDGEESKYALEKIQ